MADINNAPAPGSRACLNYMEAPEWMLTLTPDELLAKALPSWVIPHHRFGDTTLNFGREGAGGHPNQETVVCSGSEITRNKLSYSHDIWHDGVALIN
jgi:hypothetical protein